MDRMNLYFKLGSEIIIKFTDEEMDFIENIKNNVDTFDDVLDYCLLVKEFNSNKINSNNTNGEIPANSPENNNSNDTPESNSDILNLRETNMNLKVIKSLIRRL